MAHPISGYRSRCITITALTLAGVLSAATARADGEPPKESPPSGAPAESPSAARLYGQPVVTVPVGNLASATGPGFGAMLSGEYRLSDAWQVTGRAGYIAGSQTSSSFAGVTFQSSLAFAPVLAGAKVYLAGASSDVARLYGVVEGGLLFASGSGSADAGAGSVSTSGQATYACGAASAGLEIDILDLRVGLLGADLAHAGSTTATMASLGFRFASL